eukprot:COSAG02_NODE_4300_length_5532_cov_6.802503_1_plen_899_part_00
MGKGQGKGRDGPLNSVASAVDTALSSAFGGWAGVVARMPLPFIPGCIIFAMIAGGNNLRMFGTLEIRPSKMFCPPDSPAIPQSQLMKDNFEVAKRFQSFIVTDDGRNMLTKGNLQRAMGVLDTVMGMQTDLVAPSYCPDQSGGSCGEQLWDFEQLCLRQGDQCAVMSILNLWQQNATILNAQSQQQIMQRINNPPPMFPPVTEVLGGIQRDADGDIVSATAVQTVLFLEYRADPEVAEAGIMVAPWTDAPSEAWEELMVDTLKDATGVSVNTQGSQALEYLKSAISDLKKLGGGYFLVFCYTAVTFGAAFPCLPCNPGAGAVKSRAIMTFACVVTLNMSIVTSMGLCSLFGWFITPLNGALPFILLGVAVDDAFVIVTCFNEECGWHLDPDDTEGREAAMSRPVEERMSRAMKHAGVSITVTSATNVVAFGIGHSSQLPALSSFCVFASIGVLAIYCYMLTFFTACLTLDDKRQAANRRDCCPCFAAEGDTPVGSRGSKLRAFFGGPYADFLMQTPVRIAVVAVSFIWACTAAWMSTQLGQAWDWMNFVPDDSYLRNFFIDRESFPSALAYPVDIVWEVPAYPAVRQLSALETKLESSKWIQDGSVVSWYGPFCAANAAVCADDVTSEVDFIAALNLWLAAAGRLFRPDIKMNDDRSSIVLSRFQATYEPSSVATSEDMVDGMFGLRKEVDDAAPGAFPFTYQYMFWEQFAVVKEELYTNIGLALACVLVICTIMIAHPGTAFLVCLMVCATLFSMGGVDYLIDHSIDAIGMVCFAFAVGISVDYSVHIAHNFMMQTKGDRVDRVKTTLVDMGVPVFHGACSTFLAVLMLSTAVSFSMRTFFKQFASVCIFGIWHALAVLPCILSFVGAEPFGGREEDTELQMKEKSSDEKDEEAATD